MSLVHAFPPRSAEAPVALGDEPRTWAELWRDAGRVATGLDRWLGVGTSCDVMVATHDRYLAAVTLLALWARGHTAALPLHASPESIDGLVMREALAGVVHDGTAEPPTRDEGRARDLRGWLAQPAPSLAPFTMSADRRLVTVYTSGSTGAPVACNKTAGQLLGEADLLVRLFELGPATRLLATVPAQHIYGLLFSVLVPLMGGGAFVRDTPHHAESIAALAMRHAVNVLCSVPVHLHGLGALAPGTLPIFDAIVSSGAPLPASVAQALAGSQGRPVREILGSSETGGIAWRARTRETGDDAEAWLPFPGVGVEADEEGVLMLRSPFAPMPEDGRPYRAADRVRLLAGGRFLLLGREDGILKIGGSRVSVSEVEQQLRALPGVTDAAVCAVKVPSSRGHELWAAVVAPGRTVEELRRALARQLEAVALPRRFRLCEALPRESTGKLTQRRLRALFGKATGDTYSRAFVFTADSPVFEGHFPGDPLVPGVIQLNELVLGTAREAWPALGVLTRVTALKFRKPIRPGDHVEVSLRLLAEQKLAFEMRRGADVVSSGALSFALPEGA